MPVSTTPTTATYEGENHHQKIDELNAVLTLDPFKLTAVMREASHNQATNGNPISK